MEKVSYFSSLIDRHTSQLKVIFSWRYNPFLIFLSGRKVCSSQLFLNTMKLRQFYRFLMFCLLCPSLWRKLCMDQAKLDLCVLIRFLIFTQQNTAWDSLRMTTFRYNNALKWHNIYILLYIQVNFVQIYLQMLSFNLMKFL